MSSSLPKLDRRLYGILLTPSWLSGLFVTFSSLALCVGTSIISRYQASSVRLYFITYHAGRLGDTYRRFSDSILGNSFISNLPLFIFWGLVGLVVYLFAANIMTALRNTAELKNELDYVHADRGQLLWQSVRHLLVRLVVLVVWVGYIMFFFQRVLPYCVTASVVGSAQLNTTQDSLYILLSITVTAAALHIHVVLLRLLLLRPRIFSQALYADLS